MLPAQVGTAILDIDTKHFRSKMSLFRLRNGSVWLWFSALSLCSSILSPFIPSMSPKLDLKNPRKYVYYLYRWLPWTTWTMYPTSFWWHLHVCDTMLMTCWRIRHDFNSIFYIWASFFPLFYENVLPAKAGSTFSKADFCQHLVQSKISIPKMASKPLVWGGGSLP